MNRSHAHRRSILFVHGGRAAAVLLLLLIGSSAIGQPADSIFGAARSAVLQGRVDKSRVLGFHDERRMFTELPNQGGILIGFDFGIGKFFDIDNIYAIRPVYLTAWGEAYYNDYGPFADKREGKKIIKTRVLRTERVRAQPGFAVGGITVRSGLNINGMAITFMRIRGQSLDTQQAYTSPWIGDRTGGGENSITGNGAAVVGVFGSQDESHAHSLGLIFTKAMPVTFAHDPAAAAQPAPPAGVGPTPGQPAPPVAPTPAQPLAPPSLVQPPPPAPVQAKMPGQEPPMPRKEPAAAAPPKPEPPAEPTKEAVEPVAAAPAKAPKEVEKAAKEVEKVAREMEKLATGMSWIPIAVFAIVSVPAFLFLAVSFKGRQDERKRRKAEREKRRPEDSDDQPAPRPRREKAKSSGPPPIPRTDPKDDEPQEKPEEKPVPVVLVETPTPPPPPLEIQAGSPPAALPAWEQRPEPRQRPRDEGDEREQA